MMELTLKEILADTLDGIKDWRNMDTKELASILADRSEEYYEQREDAEMGWDEEYEELEDTDEY